MAHRRRRRRRRGKISDATPAQPGINTDESSAASQPSVSDSDAGDSNSGGDD